MTDVILPTIGSSGYYELRPPLDSQVVPGERYTCQAVRRISDYLANNEDIKTDVYQKLGLPDSEWESDSTIDQYIVSLQSDKGHWLYIPASYIVTYPITNGVPYRAVMIAVSLPSMPADRDLTFLETDIRNLISDSLGVVPVIKQVETSRVVLVADAVHTTKQMERDMLSSGRVTDRARFMQIQQDYQVALTKIQALEQYIRDHLGP